MSDNKKTVQEIDLLELFNLICRKIKKNLVNLLRVILFLIFFGIKRVHFIILFMLGGMAIGLFFYSQTHRFYSSDLIAQPNGISSIDMVDYIDDLSLLCKKGNKQAMSLSLSLPDSVIDKIKNIEAFHYIDVNNDNIGDFIDFANSFDAKDTTKKIISNRIYLKVDVFDNQIFDAVRTGIFYYISSNPYLLKLNELRKKELNELIIQTKKEIIKIDSLQNVEYFNTNNELTTSNESQLMFLSEKDKRMYYHDKLRLLKDKQGYEKELELSTAPITVIKDFTHLAVEENPRSGYINKYGFYFGILGYILLLLFNNRNKFSSLIKEYL